MKVNEWITVGDYRYPGGWAVADAAARAREYCKTLEEGEILFFPGVPFDFPAANREFLLSQKQAGSRFHKNISYKPAKDKLAGVAAEGDRGRVHQIMRSYSVAVTGFVDAFLAPYAGKRKMDYASFRPLEEQGRDLPQHRRNDLLHVDAFPTRPTHGARILRVFTNIHPKQPRVWRTGEPFHVLAPERARAAGVESFAAKAKSVLRPAARLARKWTAGLAPDRTAYDEFMLHFHDWLKADADYQRVGVAMAEEFPPNSTWLAFTDGVPHAALSGKYALEQTYIVPREALVAPEVAPISVLEKIVGSRMDL